MYIGKYQTTNSNLNSLNVGKDPTKTDESEKLQKTTLADWLKKSQTSEKSDNFSLLERPVEGALNLEPVERYRYMLNQAQKQTNLNTAYDDPQKALKKANEIINNAIMPPGKDNPDMAELTQALQIRQLMKGRLDLAA